MPAKKLKKFRHKLERKLKKFLGKAEPEVRAFAKEHWENIAPILLEIAKEQMKVRGRKLIEKLVRMLDDARSRGDERSDYISAMLDYAACAGLDTLFADDDEDEAPSG